LPKDLQIHPVTPPGDITAGLPLGRVIANGLAAGMSIDAILGQAFEGMGQGNWPGPGGNC